MSEPLHVCLDETLHGDGLLPEMTPALPHTRH